MADKLPKHLAALKGTTVEVTKNFDSPDLLDDASIVLTLANGIVLQTDYWRAITNKESALSSFDHKQKYGLPKPIDAIEELKIVLSGKRITNAALDANTGDLVFTFDGNVLFQAFNFTGYEAWQLRFPDGALELSNYALNR